VRPGLIVGPHDPTDRFTYWPERLARGGDVLAPGSPDRPVQFVDARDLAEWMLRLAGARATGVLHATGPARPLGMGALLDSCARAGAADARVVWVDERFLLDAGVQPWMELPLWIPDADPESFGFLRTDCSRAIAAGLTFRPLDDTVRDTLAWARSRAGDTPRRAGLAPERERELLERWRAAAPLRPR
jgi:2'-hydroxyisoflavone reductase